MPVNRLVAALTPLAAIAAGIFSEWLAKHFPGVNVPASALEEVFLGGMAAVLAPSAVWLLGWQRHEAREGTSVDRFESGLEAHERALAEAGLEPPPGAGDPEQLADLEALADDEPAALDDDEDPEFDVAALEVAAAAELSDDDDDLDVALGEDELALDEDELALGEDELALDEDELDADEDEELLTEVQQSGSPRTVR